MKHRCVDMTRSSMLRVYMHRVAAQPIRIASIPMHQFQCIVTTIYILLSTGAFSSEFSMVKEFEEKAQQQLEKKEGEPCTDVTCTWLLCHTTL